MRADRIAEIAPFVREVFAHDAERAADDEVLCMTFEVAGVDGAWAQVIPTQLNVAYTLTASPIVELGEIVQIIPEATLLDWEAEKFATWSFTLQNPYELAKAIDFVLVKLFKLGEYSINVRWERL